MSDLLQPNSNSNQTDTNISDTNISDINLSDKTSFNMNHLMNTETDSSDNTLLHDLSYLKAKFHLYQPPKKEKPAYHELEKINDKPLWQHKKQFANKKFLNKNSSVVVSRMQKQCAQVYQALMPLYQLGIHFSLALAGGAVRDLLLEQSEKIKDLDMVLSFSYGTQLPEKEKIIALLGLQKDDLDDWREPLEDNSNRNWVTEFNTYVLVQCLLSKACELDKCYPPREKKNFALLKQPIIQASQQLNEEEDEDNPEQTPYLQEKLSGVIKLTNFYDTDKNINSNTTHRASSEKAYPMDVLITWHAVRDFVERFDFSICKAWISLVKGANSLLFTFDFPQNEQQFMKKVFFHRDFIKTFYDKTIVMDISYNYLFDVQSAFKKHLPRIVAKYPGYQVKAIMRHDSWMPHEKIAIIREVEKEQNLVILDSLPVFNVDKPDIDVDIEAYEY